MRRPGPPLPAPAILFPWRAWIAHPLLRSWTTWLFVGLVAVPPLAITLIPAASTDASAPAAAFATYFAAAWFLVLWVVVRPQRVGSALLAQVIAVALVLESPLAIGLEQALHSDPHNLLVSIATIGIPEELTKLLPVALLAVLHRRRWIALAPRDFLFLAAVSGLAFGAVEALTYAVNMPVSWTGDALVLVWRLVADPVLHACWAGIAGYFLGLASRYREPGPWAALTGVGIGVPAVLHGFNDWVAAGLNLAWVLVTVTSALLFLAYARIGIAAPPATQAPKPPTYPAPPNVPTPRNDPTTIPIPRSRQPQATSTATAHGPRTDGAREPVASEQILQRRGQPWSPGPATNS